MWKDRDSPNPGKYRKVWLLGLAVSLFAVTFAADLTLPLGVSGGVPYVLPVLLTLWLPGTAVTVVFAVVGGVLGLSGHFLSPDGGAAWPLLTNRALALAVIGASAGMVIAQKNAESARRVSDERFREIADAIPGIMWIMDPGYRVVYINAYVRALIGLGDDEDIATRWAELIHPDDRAAVWAVVEDHFESVRPFEIEFRLATIGGGYADILARGRPLFDDEDRLTGYVATGLDVTEQKRVQSELLHSEAFLSHAQQVASVGSWVWEPDSGAIEWSDQMYRIVGVERGQWQGSVDSFVETIVHPNDRQDFIDGWSNMMETKLSRSSSYRIVRPDGEVRFVQAECELVLGTDGEVLRALGTMQDVTQQRSDERELMVTGERLAHAERVARFGHTEWDVQTNTEVWSDGLYRLLGLEPGVVEPSREAFLDRLVDPADRDRLTSRRNLVASGQIEPGATYRIRRTDGAERELEITGQVFKDADGNVERVFATAQDVTELREAENALRASEERFELAARGANDGLWDWRDVHSERFWLSQRYYELLGYEADELEPTITNYIDLIHPDDLAVVVGAVDAHLKRSESYDIECRMRTRSGEYRWYRTRGEAIRDEQGQPLRMAGSLQDIDAQHKSEQELARQREQLRSLAAQAALVAEKERRRFGAELHDRTVQNLGLTKVRLGALRRAAEAAGAHAEYAALAELVDATIDDARALLSEISPPVLTELGFEAAVDWLAEKAESQFGVQCTVSDDGETRILDDDAQLVLFQTVRELLANVGKHARAGSARVRISGGASEVIVRVEDDGVGFEAGDAQAHAVDQGGYGLFSIRERLRMLGGVLQIDSRPQTGTSVTVSVPVRH
jgi:two-component system sensor histidine kinase UhpB